MDATQKRKSDVKETQSLADWKMAVLPLFDKLTQRSTYVGAAVRLKSVAAHLSPETLGPFVVCVFFLLGFFITASSGNHLPPHDHRRR